MTTLLQRALLATMATGAASFALGSASCSSSDSTPSADDGGVDATAASVDAGVDVGSASDTSTTTPDTNSPPPVDAGCTALPWVVLDASTCGSALVEIPSAYDGGTLSLCDCHAICGTSGPLVSCTLAPADAGTATVTCQCAALGRRPNGLRRVSSRAKNPVGAWFADAARLEAASVHAFDILRAELALHGAPDRLLHAAECAAEDERRHTRAMSALARRHAARARPPTVPARPVRTLEAIAIENAVEGCVGETYAALLAMWQSHTAREPKTRATLRMIARDETRHATLAWQVARWTENKLDGCARARVAAARRAAGAALVSNVSREPEDALVQTIGLPRAADARALASRLAAAMWA